MTGPRDPGLARVADLLEQAARELRAIVGSSGIELPSLGQPEAECRPSPNKTSAHPTMRVTLLLTRAEIIALLRVGDRTFNRMRRDPKLKFPAPVRGRPLRWRRGDFDRWLAGGRR